jgi:hypothetical protein
MILLGAFTLVLARLLVPTARVDADRKLPALTLTQLDQFFGDRLLAEFCLSNPTPYTISCVFPFAVEDGAGGTIEQGGPDISGRGLTVKPRASGMITFTLPKVRVWRIRMTISGLPSPEEPRVRMNLDRARRAWHSRSLRPFWTPLPVTQRINSPNYTNQIAEWDMPSAE